MNVEISKVDFGYAGGPTILHNVSVTVSTGSTVAIVGPSGCGKTTLLRIIAGILGPDNGVVSWDGLKINLNLRRKGKIGYMFQTPTLLPHLSIAENVGLPFASTGLDGRLNQYRDDILRKMGLSRFASYLPDQLSVGMRSRVALARTFITGPNLLLLDEPFSALDIGWRLALYKQWRAEATHRILTTILVTHDVHEAFLLASRIVIMSSHGRIAQIIECNAPKPDDFDLDSVRAFSIQNAEIIERTQYEISRDVIATQREQIQ